MPCFPRLLWIVPVVVQLVLGEDTCDEGCLSQDYHTSLLQVDLSMRRTLSQDKVAPYYVIGGGYTPGGQGKCEDVGMFSITDRVECIMAAQVVGVPPGNGTQNKSAINTSAPLTKLVRSLHHSDPKNEDPDNVGMWVERKMLPYGCSFVQGSSTKETGAAGATGALYFSLDHGDNNGGHGGFVFICKTMDSALDSTPVLAEAPAHASIYDPLPSLVWLNDFDKIMQEGLDKTLPVLRGDLTVPLDPQDDKSPSVKVRVHARLAETQPASLGALVIHCGDLDGSGAQCVDRIVSGCGGADCPLKLDTEIFKFFDVLAIDQRGTGASQPQIKCKESELNFKLPPLGKGSYTASDFSSCDCFGALNVFREDADDAILRHSFAEQSAQAKRCYESQKFQLANGYNFLDYVGTEYLAHDYDALRRAIGQTSINFYGLGYGTVAGAAYASIYPARVNRTVFDSSVAFQMDPHDIVNDVAKIHEQAVQDMARSCQADKSCPMAQDALVVFSNAVDEIEKNGEVPVDTNLGKKVVSPSALVRHAASLSYATHAAMQGGIAESRWRQFAQFAQSLGQDKLKDVVATSEATMASAVELLLDDCKIPISKNDVANCVDSNGESQLSLADANGTYMCKTWKQYGLCLSRQTNQHSFVNAAIIGADVPGRYSPSQWIRSYRQMHTRHGIFGALAASELADISFWPGRATPIAFGSSHTKPFLVKVSRDSQIGTEWTQAMHAVFPAGKIITWRGTSNAVDTCPAIRNYLVSGHLPMNSFAC